jgi:hypothetical protein
MDYIKKIALHSKDGNIEFKFVGFERSEDYGMVTANYEGSYAMTIAHGYKRSSTVKQAIQQLREMNNPV